MIVYFYLFIYCVKYLYFDVYVCYLLINNVVFDDGICLKCYEKCKILNFKIK